MLHAFPDPCPNISDCNSRCGMFPVAQWVLLHSNSAMPTLLPLGYRANNDWPDLLPSSHFIHQHWLAPLCIADRLCMASLNKGDQLACLSMSALSSHSNAEFCCLMFPPSLAALQEHFQIYRHISFQMYRHLV